MTKVLRYLKPHILSLFFVVALVCCTVVCDLSLPTLMSDIVSGGIQQNGITDSAPDALSKNGFELMTTFMTDEEKQQAETGYTLHKSSPDDTLTERYPLLASEDIYVLNETGKEMRDELNDSFGKATLTFFSVMKTMQPQGEQSDVSTQSEKATPPLTEIYPMTPILQNLPQEQMAAARKTADETEALFVEQVGVSMAKSFYEELGANIDSMQMGYIIYVGLMMVGLTLCGGLATVFISLLCSRIAANVARALRRDIFHKVTGFSNTEFDQFSTASLITRTTNDVTQIQLLLTIGIRMVLQAPLMGIGGTVMALGKSASLAWVIALSVLMLLCLIGVIFVIAMPKFTKMQKLVDRMNLVARENLSGIMVTRAFDNEDFEKNRYDAASKDLAHTQLFVNRLMVVMMPAMMLIMNLTSLLIVWVGAHQVADSAMQIGDMMAFIQYSMQIIMAFLMIAMMFILVPRAAVSAKRIKELLNTESVIRDPDAPKQFDPQKKGVIEFRDVSFRYPNADEPVIEHISFTAEPGKTTAFIGSTGSGKSTLINLIPRFYDCTEGQVLVNGVDVRDVAQHDLRDRIGYVPQKGMLHKGTIATNITYGKDGATNEDLIAAAEVAQAMDFIRQKEDGMETEIAASGTNVSGGQKQRISIARALVRKPDFYIFDDSFSALDFKTDAALRRALKSYTEDATVLIVAQRVGTILNADQILVLDEGKVVGKGTHEELLANCPVYHEIASSQLTKEEMA